MSDHVLYLAAIILFVIAAVPNQLTIRCEWLAFACLVATLL